MKSGVRIIGLMSILLVASLAIALYAQASEAPSLPTLSPPQNFYGHRWLLGGDEKNQNASWIALQWVSGDRYELQRSNGQGVWKTLPHQGWDFYADIVPSKHTYVYRIRTVHPDGEFSEWVETPPL